MTQSIFNSVRKLNLYNYKSKNINDNESVGDIYKKETLDDYGSLPEPSCMDYDPDLDIIVLANKKGIIKVYGRPGCCFTGSEVDGEEIYRTKFVRGTGYVVSLTVTNRLSLWRAQPIRSRESGSRPNRLERVGHSIENLAQLSAECGGAMDSSRPSITPSQTRQKLDVNNNNDGGGGLQWIVAMEVASQLGSVLLGDVEGSLIQVKLEMAKMKHKKKSKKEPEDVYEEGANVTMWSAPSSREVISRYRFLSKMPSAAQMRNQQQLGPLHHISARPGARTQLLLGFQLGDCLLYDVARDCLLAMLRLPSGLVTQDLLTWRPADAVQQDAFLVTPQKNRPRFNASNQLFTGHDDGSLLHWTLPAVDTEASATATLALCSEPCRPFSDSGRRKCLPITKLIWRKSILGADLLIYAGGLPRSEYMSKSTITIDSVSVASTESQPTRQRSVVELTSPLVDMYPIDDSDNPGHIRLLAVLTEEEFMLLELNPSTLECRPHPRQPYLCCLHHSPVTAYQFLAGKQCPANLLSQLTAKASTWTDSVWPITGDISGGGGIGEAEDVWQDRLLLTGHGDGSIHFWQLGRAGCLRRLHCLRSAPLFADYDDHEAAQDLDEDITMKKIGVFDPCGDDNRYSIQLIQLSGEFLVVGGFAGQVILWQLSSSARRSLSEQSKSRQLLEADLTTHLPGFDWRGCRRLDALEEQPSNRRSSDYLCQEPLMLLTVYPPSQITALDLDVVSMSPEGHSNQLMVACGTMHGLVAASVTLVPGNVSATAATIVTSHCTVPYSPGARQEAGLGEGWARRRTRDLKKSMRDSFRRLRRRSTKRADNPAIRRNLTVNAGSHGNQGGHGDNAKDQDGVVRVELVENDKVGFEERVVEDRPRDTANNGLVKCVKVCHLGNGHDNGYKLCLLAGTAGGLMFYFSSDIKQSSNAHGGHDNSGTQLRLTKQYQLQHGAPILLMTLLSRDGSSCYGLLPNGSSPKLELLLVVSEEQIRLYSLPNLALRHKLRVTAVDGYRLRSAAVVRIPTTITSNQAPGTPKGEQLLCCTNNGGQMVLYSTSTTPNSSSTNAALKKKDALPFADKSDIMALTCVVMATLDGSSPSMGLNHSGQGQVTQFHIVPKIRRSSRF